MALMIDTSRALLQPAELHRLVCAVEAAQDEDEVEWLEWKSRLDLRTKTAHVELACQIVAMANRRVTEATRFAEGYGYVLVGVEPGRRHGVARVDSADLRPGVERYLGFDGPRWTERYDTADGTSVLVIVIDPPQYGHLVHRIVREFVGIRPGAIFVRKGAQTVAADPGDLNYLTSRAAREPDPDFPQWSTDDFPPSAAGVHRAARPNTRTAEPNGAPPVRIQPGEWWDLPPYVSRDHDAELRGRLAAAARGGGFVLVTGRSCVGKTRSVWEAIRSESFRGWRLARPPTASALRSAALSDKLRSRTIVWLDEMQLFLSKDGGDGLTADDLRALWTRRSPVVVIGTMWPDLYDEMVSGISARGQESSDRARQVLELAGTPVRVPDRLEEPELDRARKEARTDDTIRWALRDPDHGMTQMLAGVPWLVQRWEQPRSGYTKSVLAAAAAVARLGIRGPVSADFLREAARSYFPSRRAAPAGWFARSLAEATELIRDVVSPLIPESDPVDDDQLRYRLTDYLVQYTADGRGVEPVPEPLWSALLAHDTTPSQRLSLVHSAGQRLLHMIAEPLLRQALDAGDDWAHRELASLLTFQGRFDEAVEHERAAHPGPPSFRLADLLVRAGRLDELRELARTNSGAAARLQREEREDHADQVGGTAPGLERTRMAAVGGLAVQGLAGELVSLAEGGDPYALYWAVDLLASQGRVTEAFNLAVRHQTDELSARPLWELLARNVRVPDAVTGLYQRVENHRQAEKGLAGLLFGRYRDETMRLAQEDPHVLVNLAFLLHASGCTDDGIGLLRDSDTEDPCQCPVTALATLLADTDQVDEATGLLRPIRTQLPWGPPFRPRHVDALLARILYQHHREDELEAMAEESAPGRREWARVLAERGQVEAAAKAFREAAPWLDRGPLIEMGVMLAAAGQVERAFRDVRDFSEQTFGIDHSSSLAAELAGQGRIEDLRRAAAAGQRSAEVYLTALLAAECPAADLARRTVSGDRYAADALILLAVTGYLTQADKFRRFGLRPDGTIALGPGRDEWTVPNTASKPERAVLLGYLPFLNYD